MVELTENAPTCCKCRRTELLRSDLDTREVFCLFHAPVDKKGITPAEFRDKVLEEFARSQEAGEEYCDLSEAVFPEVDFSSVEFTQAANFRWAEFSAAANFFKATFTEAADFREAQFTEAADFGWATFSAAADFNEAKFSEYASFGMATFTKTANFRGAKFTQANFSQAAFTKAANFNGAEFTAANFSEARFTEAADFSRSTLTNVKLFRAQFNKDVDFSFATFNQKAEFTQLFVKERIFFIHIDLTRVEISFLQTDLRKFQFESCTWRREGGRREGREILWDELAVAGLAETTPESRATKADEYTKVGDLYRRLKQKYKEEHNEPEASTWHYNEKEMLRKVEGLRRRSSSDRLTSLKTWFSFALLTIYYYSSGYAERPLRAGFWMLGLMMVYPVVISWCDLDFKHQPPAQV
ncbi:MAG: pentapeptide repeat-containing protein, partial [Deltaproteobacteria bacterium]|nr:pentapeptide repeat-containing protein [Deltaproteobacteria bacterium]